MRLLIPLVLAILSCFALELATRESGVRRARAPGILLGRAALYALLFAFWFQFSWRPWLAGVSTALTLVALAVVNHLKKGVIGEPLVFSDFALLRQVPRHPELYYTRPLGDPRVFGPLLAAVAVVALWYALELTLLPASGLGAVAAVVMLSLALLGLLRAVDGTGPLARGIAALAPRPDLRRDVGRWGLLATLVLYTLAWRRECRAVVRRPNPPAVPRKPVAPGAGPVPVIVVAQLESFLDPTRLGDPTLPLLERARAQAWQYGRLRVPAHGAYTMRSEHAVLTGLDEDDLGFGRFDPYLSLKGRLADTLPRSAAAAGFESVFVHPFAPRFFDRAGVVRAMGFDRLVMEDAFAGAPRHGRYVADRAVAERILAEADAARTPLLVFTVTMENHGPWRPGRLPGLDEPLRQYMAHVRNAGAAMEAILDGLAGRPGFLCLFGDHAPSLAVCPPGFGEGMTDYAIVPFDPRLALAPREIALDAAELGRVLRRLVGHVAGHGARDGAAPAPASRS